MTNSKYEYVKSFETKTELLKNTYIVVRIDGKGFTKFCSAHNFLKPNDIRALRLMDLAGLTVMKNFNEIFLAYGESDEFSFAFKKNAKLFNRRREKIITNIVSDFTAAYVFYWNKFFDCEMKYPPCFDGRIVLYPSFDNLKDYFSWRYVDCHINNLYNTAFWKLVNEGKMSTDEAHKKLKGTTSGEKNELLFSQFNVNYNNEPEIYKKGSLLIRFKKNNKPNNGNKNNNPSENFIKENNVSIPYKTDEILYKDDEFMSKTIEAYKDEIIIAHADVIKDTFWDKNIIDYD